jgi:hypothetical protein
MTTLTRRAQAARLQITEPMTWLSWLPLGLGAGIVGMAAAYSCGFLLGWLATL